MGPAASALGAAQVRFVNAVPGAGPAQLSVKGEGIGGALEFGQVGGYSSVDAGAATFQLRIGASSSTTAQERLRNGKRYTVIALGGDSEKLRVLSDGPGRPATSRLRVVHAAPELGKVEVRLGDNRVATLLGFESVAGYAPVDPGVYAIRVTRPGGGSTLAARGAVPLTAGTASTAFVIGSGGEPLQVVVAADGSAAPSGAPHTGLGGLSDDGPPFLLALLAGLLAAAAGMAGYVAVTGRSRGGGL